MRDVLRLPVLALSLLAESEARARPGDAFLALAVLVFFVCDPFFDEGGEPPFLECAFELLSGSSVPYSFERLSGLSASLPVPRNFGIGLAARRVSNIRCESDAAAESLGVCTGSSFFGCTGSGF